MILDELKNFKVVLASQSPRRRELLKLMGIDFEAVSADLDESFDPSLQAADIPSFLSEKKARFFQNQYDSKTLIIASDTIVWMNNQALNKPLSREEAEQMLRSLSGNTHEVYTAVTVLLGNDVRTQCDCTQVTFQTLSEEEIQYYIDVHHPFDKAGSYGAQDFIGLIGIAKLSGSFYTVMGLPTHMLYQMIKTMIQKTADN
jgi:septum formation protein